MSISLKTTAPSKPTGSGKVSFGTLSYFRSRNKHRVFNLVIKEFEKSGLTQADLGRRLGMDTGQLSRYLNAPGNWTLDMLSDFLFAISGAEAGYDIVYPLEQPPRNFTEPPWLQKFVRSPRTRHSTDLNRVLLDNKQQTNVASNTVAREALWEPA